ncbi:dipeptidyl aminopeptidase/acylaminoacyl peptidase [Nocardioides sp. BE266]|uniref:alpha/beta hydrolase family protein n=1 Tax=Nocardioides sp. BE266 TaxID=2817725 RepID=UPI00285EAEBB|nr:prolyl oligopeptidase family serine peptidase [Nocardioides sp. BE266]MDR7253119.1 dipeptidyl aminopeptidase/acylaminoacyl peptidase [Nocardioides sp. BE266]
MDAHRRRAAQLATTAVVSLPLLAACSGERESADPPGSAPSSRSTSAAPSPSPSEEPTPEATSEPTEPPDPISVAALADAELTGGGLRLGAVRERTSAYTSYDVTFASTTSGNGSAPLRISGVLNVPTWRGPQGDQGWPAVVLAHGYIDPAYYVRGQGMTRERGFLAERGYVALHVDYRNHAESTDDPRVETAVRLGYSADVIAAVHALTGSRDVRVDPDRIALFGRSMGSGVVLKALEAEPGLVAAGVAWASVSSLEGQNFDHFQRPDAPVAQLRAGFRGRHGLPDDDPEFWRGVSSRPAFDEITEPVLLAHGRFDDTCPPRWARATQRALTDAGVDSTLEWYDDTHAFGPAFIAAMDRTVRFLDARMPA